MGKLTKDISNSGLAESDTIPFEFVEQYNVLVAMDTQIMISEGVGIYCDQYPVMIMPYASIKSFLDALLGEFDPVPETLGPHSSKTIPAIHLANNAFLEPTY